MTSNFEGNWMFEIENKIERENVKLFHKLKEQQEREEKEKKQKEENEKELVDDYCLDSTYNHPLVIELSNKINILFFKKINELKNNEEFKEKSFDELLFKVKNEFNNKVSLLDSKIIDECIEKIL